MELRYSFVVLIGIATVLILILFRYKKIKIKYKVGKKVANTKYIKNNSKYQKVLKKHKLLILIIEFLLIMSILISFVLLSRPVQVSKIENSVYNRDIVLCMDVSGSVLDLNEKIIKSLIEIVENLNGERFAISIFNTTSVMLSPLTDDYDYILTILNDLLVSIDANDENNYDSFYNLDYIMAGTTTGYEEYGSSLVGDGLASCINLFGKLEEKERTRIIIFSTDNDAYPTGTPLFTLEEASQFAKENKILAYGIATENITYKNNITFKNAMEATGGKLYEEGSNLTVEDIVENIEKTTKTEYEKKIKKAQNDMPLVPFIILVSCIIPGFILSKKVINNDC